MNGLQIDHLLSLIEDKSASNREAIRREVATYLRTYMASVVEGLATSGEVFIPTSYGGLKLTKADLSLVAA